jgi:drug/metabolite transporter (DMT)-like permease
MPGAAPLDQRPLSLQKLTGDKPVAAAVVGALTIAFSAILVRYASVSPETAAFFRCLYALPALGAIAFLEDKRFGKRVDRDRRIAFVAGIFFAGDLIVWHHAIEAVGAGLSTVLANLQVVFVGLIAWLLLGEKPHKRSVTAAPVALVGVVFISGVMEGGEVYGDDPKLGVVLGIVTALLYSGFLLVLRRGSADLRRPAGPLFDATATAAVVSAGYGLVTGTLDLVPGQTAQAWLITLALTSQVLGWLLITSSLPRLPAALTSVLLTIQPLGSVVLGAVLLAERPTVLQLGGVALVVVAVVAATARPRRAPAAP